MMYESMHVSVPSNYFIPDTKRGHWAKPNDFIYAGLSLAFRFDIFALSSVYLIDANVIYFMPECLMGLFIYIVPFIVIQSFLGQFSSSSYISAFRFTPLYKGIGYVALILNICILSFYSVFATVALAYMFSSMQPTLPWNCENYQKWSNEINLTALERINLCNLYVPYENDVKISGAYIADNNYIPSALYFRTFFKNIYGYVDFSMSWQLVLCDILVWTIVILFFYKFFNTERFGIFIRYTIWILLGLLSVLLIRFSFLPGSGKVYSRIFVPTWMNFVKSLVSMPIYSLYSFGPGWGLFITLSSFNKFKTNIIKKSWFIGIGQMVIVIGLNLLANLVKQYFKEVTGDKYYSTIQHLWIPYLSAGSAMTDMTWANLWSILYYLMLFLAAMLSIIMELYTILTTIFDEFALLRECKVAVGTCIIAVIAPISLYFTSYDGCGNVYIILVDTYFINITLNLLLILTVLWIYGRERFQRDMKFMTNTHFPTWQVNALRFVVPLALVLILIYFFFEALVTIYWANNFSPIFALIFMIILILLIPIYAVYYVCQTDVGRPNYWYPVEPEERERYENVVICNNVINSEQKDLADNINISEV